MHYGALYAGRWVRRVPQMNFHAVTFCSPHVGEMFLYYTSHLALDYSFTSIAALPLSARTYLLFSRPTLCLDARQSFGSKLSITNGFMKQEQIPPAYID